ncbi:GPI-anchored wall transfer protein 1, partial [Dictyocoela muelleri]
MSIKNVIMNITAFFCNALLCLPLLCLPLVYNPIPFFCNIITSLNKIIHKYISLLSLLNNYLMNNSLMNNYTTNYLIITNKLFNTADVKVFLVTGITTLSSLLRILYGINNDHNWLTEFIWWILPQYFAIIYIDVIFYLIFLLLIVIYRKRGALNKIHAHKVCNDKKKKILHKQEIRMSDKFEKDLGKYDEENYKKDTNKNDKCANYNDEGTNYNNECNNYNNKGNNYNDEDINYNDEDNNINENEDSDYKYKKYNNKNQILRRRPFERKRTFEKRILYVKQNKSIKVEIKTVQKENKILFFMRSTMMLQVIIAIFACDFKIFPKDQMKSKSYGITLMDIGVGSFLVNNGTLSVIKDKKSLLKSSLILITLGFIRLFVINNYNYYVDITEYGYHFNFYFIMGIIYFIYALIKSKFDYEIGLVIMIVYELIIEHTSLDTYILSDKRNNFLAKNKEGLFGIISSLSIFLISTEFGRLLFENKYQRDKVNDKMYLNDSNNDSNDDSNNDSNNNFQNLNFTTYLNFRYGGFMRRIYLTTNINLIHKIAQFVQFMIKNKKRMRIFVLSLLFIPQRLISKPSRRIGNLSYILFIISLHTFYGSLGSMILNKIDIKPFSIQKFVSKNMMLVFLVANLFILVFNLKFDSEKFNSFEIHTILILYLIICFPMLKFL